jgi:hypothetical protein
MQSDLIQQLQDLTATLGKMIVSFEPTTPQDWEAMEKMQAAHKQMRSIDIAELIEKPPRAAITR